MVTWGGGWWWDSVGAVLGKDQYWLFCAQSLFPGSFHVRLHNSLESQWDCCRARMEGTPLCHGKVALAASVKCLRMWPQYGLLKVILVSSFWHMPGVLGVSSGFGIPAIPQEGRGWFSLLCPQTVLLHTVLCHSPLAAAEDDVLAQECQRNTTAPHIPQVPSQPHSALLFAPW